MYVYAGIDEAGYGPLFGPLLVGRAVLAIPRLDASADPPALWQRLSKAVCRSLAQRKGRIVVNDSKKLITPAAGLRHLELGCLAFAALADQRPTSLDGWLRCLGQPCDDNLAHLPWYAACDQRPWDGLPVAATDGEIAIARNMLRSTAQRIGVDMADLGAAVVFEDRFNQMVAATRSKAATSFTFVAGHLRHVWDHFGQHHPFVAVDRQGGRTQYDQQLAMNFPEAHLRVLEATPERSSYHLQASDRAMTVRFQVEAEQAHMPVALASMISKYTRELFMARFNRFFHHHLPAVKPTAGYALDARRFLQDIQPHLPELGINPATLCRQA